jgi:hypothetical protein
MPNKSTSSAPIRIGYCLSLTGPVADNSRSAQLAHEIWREDINNRGACLAVLSNSSAMMIMRTLRLFTVYIND